MVSLFAIGAGGRAYYNQQYKANMQVFPQTTWSGNGNAGVAGGIANVQMVGNANVNGYSATPAPPVVNAMPSTAGGFGYQPMSQPYQSSFYPQPTTTTAVAQPVMGYPQPSSAYPQSSTMGFPQPSAPTGYPQPAFVPMVVATPIQTSPNIYSTVAPSAFTNSYHPQPAASQTATGLHGNASYLNTAPVAALPAPTTAPIAAVPAAVSTSTTSQPPAPIVAQASGFFGGYNTYNDPNAN